MIHVRNTARITSKISSFRNCFLSWIRACSYSDWEISYFALSILFSITSAVQKGQKNSRSCHHCQISINKWFLRSKCACRPGNHISDPSKDQKSGSQGSGSQNPELICTGTLIPVSRDEKHACHFFSDQYCQQTVNNS